MKKASDLLISNLKRQMNQRGWKAQDLARETKISPQLLSRYLKGERGTWLQNLDIFASALKIEIKDLFEDEPKEREISPAEALEVLKRALNSPYDPLVALFSRLPQRKRPGVEKFLIAQLGEGIDESESGAGSESA